MRKLWTVVIDGTPHQVDVTWDVAATGCGRIVVDGVELERWSLGVKLPGQTKELVVAGRKALVRQGVLDFELFVDGAQVPGARLAPWSRPPAAIAITAALVFGVLLVAGLVALLVWALAAGAR